MRGYLNNKYLFFFISFFY